MTRDPRQLCKKLGLTFNNFELFKQAITHRSAGAANNERLEFLGDSILGFVIAERLCETFPDASEGVLSRLRAGLVNEESLAAMARELELGDYLILGSGELKSGGFKRDSILSDALEALMGALVLDQGFDVCKTWIQKLFDGKIFKLSMKSWIKDPKTRLQEFLQSKKLDLPVYTLKSMSGLPHEQSFLMECQVSLLPEPCIGEGPSRKKAEQDAAEKALAKLLDFL